MHEVVHGYKKDLRIAPKLTSSGKAEQYVIHLVMKHLRALLKSSFVVRIVNSIAVRREGGITQWSADFN